MAFKDYSKDIENARKNANANNKKNSNPSKIKDYSSEVERYRLSNSIDLNTFQSDLTTVYKSMTDAYSGWQTKETMANTLSSVQSMYDRLNKYQDYQKKYGGADLSELRDAFKSAIDGWGDMSNTYGMFKNADAFNKEIKTLGNLYSMSSEDIQSKMDVDKLDEIYNTANSLLWKPFTSYVDKFDVTKNNRIKIPGLDSSDTIGFDSEKFNSTGNAYKDYLNSVGFESLDDIKKAKSGIAYTTADGNNIMWKDLYDSAYLREYEQDIDKNLSVEQPIEYKKKDAKYSRTANGYVSIGDEFAHKYNYINGDKEASDVEELINVHLTNTSDSKKDAFYTDAEKQRFNFIAETQGEEKALEYAKLLDSDLRQRRVDYQKTFNAENAKENPIATSIFSVIDNLGNNAIALPFLALDYAEDGSIDSNSSLYTGRRRVQTERGTVEGMIDNDIGQFLYRHGMNTADNVAAMAVSGFGKIGGLSKLIQTGVLSSGAAVDGAIDAKSRGLSDEQALGLGVVAGAAEYIFESKGYEALFDTKNLTRSGAKYFLDSLKTEMIGELSTEALNDVADILISQDLNKFKTEVDSYLASGMSEKEAFNKTFKEAALRYADVAGGTLFSTGIISGTPALVGSYTQNSYNTEMGKTIKSNERVGELFDIASNPEVASAYEVYTKYANKGITADNISDAKLGRLYTNARLDIQDTLESKKSTPEQKQSALNALTRLAMAEATENTAKKEIKNEAKQFNVGKETMVTETGETIDIKGIKLKGDNVILTTDKGEISTDETTLSQDNAELVGVAKQIAKENGEDIANLFVSEYDGKTAIEKYADNFNLVTAYAKNNFSLDTILERKEVLSTDTIKSIYQKARTEVDKAQKEKFEKLVQETADKKFYKGFIDDSAIDYDNTSAEGKVNWKDLTARQREAVTFIKGIAKASGMNLRFVANNPKANGSYDKTSNTLTINLDEGGYDAINDIKETIIPTMSHETTHWMKEKSPELWTSLNGVVFSTLVDHYNSEKGLNDKVEILRKLYKARGKAYIEEALKSQKLTEEDLIDREYLRLVNRDTENGKEINEEALKDEAREEIIARACEDMLKMSEQGRKIFTSLSESEQKTLFDKMKAIINDLLNWVNKLLNSYEATSTEARIMREYKEQLQKASEVWDKMLEESVKVNQALEKSGAFKNNNSGERIVFCERIDSPSEFNPNGLTLREQLIEAFDEAQSKDRRYVYVGEFTQSFIGKLKKHIVIKNLPIVMNYRDAYLSMESKENGKYQGEGINYHNLGVDGLKSALESFENPEYVLLSTKKNKIELILEGIDYKKRQLFSIVEINTSTQHNKKFLPVHVVTSVYGNRGIKKRIEIAEQDGRVIYNKKEDLSQGMSQVQYKRDINDNSSKDIIRNSDKNVKEIFSDKDSTGRNLSEGQMEYFKDSTVRDENGNLLVMYRGDSNEFTIFDKKKTNYSNLYGRGFYFTKRKEHAEQYGKSREFYLDIKNPLSPKQNVITKKQMLNFLKAIENDGEDYDLYNYGQDATAESVLESVWGKGDFEMLQDINAGAIGDLVAAVELFNEVNGTNYDGIVLPTETVTFNSEQAKLTSNLNPTEDKDIRFSMKENVEETRDLVAVHNMRVSELDRTLDLGGLPMPSIAIIKAKSGHSEYGDVSLVFPKSTIDPKADKNNKVYGGDAWTPVYPKIEYKPSAKVSKKINDKYYELSRKFGYDESRPLYKYVYDLEEQLNRHNGEAELIEELYEDQNMMQLYLLDSGKSKVETIQKEIRTELTDAEVEMNEFFIKELGADVVDELTWNGEGTPFQHRTNYFKKYESAIRDTYLKLLKDEYKFTDEQVQNVLDSTKPADYLKFIRDANKYRQNGRVIIKTEADYEATKQAIKEASGDGYRNWVDSLFKGVEEKSGIRNNADYFTNSGNRRSWEALHWENNLENVVKVMKSQDNGSVAFFSGQAIWGVSAKDYKSIEEIKADADRLKRMPEEEYNEIKEGFGERLSEIAKCIMDKTERNPFIAVDNAMECMIDALRHSKTKSGILNYLKQFNHLTVTETNVNDLVSLVTDIANMPTEYFEAKPKRAVELNEIATAIIPDNTSDATKTRLDDMGIKYLEYESGNEESRLNALNSLEDVLFSEKSISLNMSEDERYEILKDKKITLTPLAVGENVDIDFEFLENNIKSVVEKPLKNKLRSLGYLKKYKTDAIDVEFEFTGKGLGKSLHSQMSDYGGNFADFTKVILNLQELLNSSVLIEMHTDKGKGTNKEKRGLEKVYVLFSALKDQEKIIPVQFEVEQYLSEENRLYLSVALTKIEIGVMGNTASDEQKATSLLPISNISIADIFSKINPIDRKFLKYVPNQFLNEEQIKAKNEALEIDKKKYSNDEVYSEKDPTIYDTMGETEALRKDYEKLKADFERAKERLALEKKITGGNVFNQNQLGAVAGHLRNIAKSNMDKVELMKALKGVYSYIVSEPNLTWEEVYERCSKVAEDMLAEAKPITLENDYAKQLLKEIRNTRISLTDEQKQDASYSFDGAWNRYFFGKVIIDNEAINIDAKWAEWASLYPDVFDADIGNNKIRELYDVINSLKEATESIDEYAVAEQKRWLAGEIYNQYWNVSAVKTTADKYDAKLKRLQSEHRQTMNELRNSYEEKLESQRLVDDMYYKRKMAELKTKGDEKLKAKLQEQREKQIQLYKNLRERKDREVAIAKQHGKDLMSQYKENAERKTRIQRITANALTLNKWLTKNSKDYHIHEAMKAPVIKLLQAIDFSSKRMLEQGAPTQKDVSFAEAFAEVKTMLVNADNMVEGLEALYGHDLAEGIDLLVKATYNLVGDNNYILNSMNSEQLESLDKLVRHIKKVVTDLNKFHTIQHEKGAVNLGNEFMADGEKIGNIEKQHGKIKKFFEFRNRTPYYFFKSLGNAGEKLFKAFQDGWDKLAFNVKKVIDYAEETYTTKEVQEWSKEIKKFKFNQPDGTEREFEMSTAQIMALHCVAKQTDAQKHLLTGGMTLKRLDKKGHVVADYENISLTVENIQSILGTLTDRQREVADKLQKFMNTVCSAWGNEISMARFGIEMFGIPDYFPIKVSEATVPTDNTRDVDNVSLFRLLNMSFTKARNQNANQSIEIGDIFDIFAQHASDMAKYNALALPVLDFNKFYSIHGKNADGKEYGVVKTLKSVFGDEANGYLRRFVRDINGSQNVSRDALGNTFFKNAKVASVAANLRVVLLQPTAFFKASAVMDNKYLLKASAYIKVEPISMVKKLKKAISNAEKYCGIVQWKSLGYYDTDISKGITEKIKHADGIKDKIIEKSMKLTEIADKATFGTLWVACEFEIRDTRKDLKVGSEEFYKAIAERLRDVIYATQVVDSTMTRSDMMRSPDGRDKMLTAFGSEPTIAYNMLLDLVTQFNRDKKAFGKKEAQKRNGKKTRKVITAYVATNLMAALIESGFDWLRDDDDEEMDIVAFMKLYLKNFLFDMSIGNKLPGVKDAYSILQGYSSSRMDTQWLQSVNYVMKDIKKVAEGEGDVSKLIKDALKAGSYFSGLPAYNVYRDAMAILDKLELLDD